MKKQVSGTKVFISYSREDWHFITVIRDRLKKNGYNVWMDEDVNISEEWWKSICNGIVECTHFLIFLTPRSLASPYCRAEIDFAAKLDKVLIALRLQHFSDELLPSSLRTVQYKDVTARDFSYILKLIRRRLDSIPQTQQFSHDKTSIDPLGIDDNAVVFPPFPAEAAILDNDALRLLAKALHLPIISLLTRHWLGLHDDLSGISTLREVLDHKLRDFEIALLANQKLERIGDEICRYVGNFITSEKSSLHIYSTQSAIYAVQERLYDLIKLPLDNNMLQDNFLQVRNTLFHQRGLPFPLNRQEEISFGLLLEHICQAVTAIVKGFPPYTPLAIIDVDIERAAKKSLDHLLFNNTAYNTPEQFEIRYRHHISSVLDRMEILGIDVSTQRYPLENAYISLSLKTSMGDAGPVLADKVLANQRRWIVIGDAGSGKSTLMRWIAVRAASKSFPESLRHWNNKVPFLIILREYTDSDFPSISDFPGNAQSVIGDPPRDWVQEKLMHGEGIILIDGLDEIDPDKRQRLYEWIAALLTQYPDAIFIISSRPLSKADELQGLEELDFSMAEFQPMQLNDIYRFIDHWHEAVQSRKRQQNETQNVKDIARLLKEQLPRNPSLFRLATNPLLCAAICALHKEKDKYGDLPSNRLDVYRLLCDMLVYNRDAATGVATNFGQGLDRTSRLVILRHLAHYMLIENQIEIDKAKATGAISNKLITMKGKVGDYRAEDVLEFLLVRSAILSQPTKNTIGFPHKTILEYLAAQEAIHQNHINLLTGKAQNELWRLTIILASGLGNIDQRNRLIGALLETDSVNSNLLAVGCLELAEDINPELRHEIERRAAALIPPQTAASARDLAAAGDLVVPHLAQKASEQISDADRGRCILTLALIGSQASLDVLKQFSQESGASLLLRYWDYFDREQYAKLVLSDFTELELNNLDGVEFLVNLKKLTVLDCEAIDTLAPLANLGQLEDLILKGLVRIADLGALKELKTLRRLHLDRLTGVSNLTALSGLINLETLELTGLYQINDLTAISDLSNLKYLVLRNLEKVVDVSPLSFLIELQHLELSGIVQIDDVISLVNLQKLETLYLFDYRIYDFTDPLLFFRLPSLKKTNMDFWLPESAKNDS